MAVQKVVGDVFGNNCGIGFEGADIGVAELGCDFESDVEELAQVRIVGRVCRIVAERGSELLAGPAIDFLPIRSSTSPR